MLKIVQVCLYRQQVQDPQTALAMLSIGHIRSLKFVDREDFFIFLSPIYVIDCIGVSVKQLWSEREKGLVELLERRVIMDSCTLMDKKISVPRNNYAIVTKLDIKGEGVKISGCDRCHLHEDQAQDALDRPVVEKISASDDNRVRERRPRGEYLNPAFASQRHTAPTAGVMPIEFNAEHLYIIQKSPQFHWESCHDPPAKELATLPPSYSEK
ncbi:hypothetical protein TNCV_3973121 [Trichonephila clavipes]|nr:hypothetical protein TNCV_3973121 [Trichonephila clavipes]